MQKTLTCFFLFLLLALFNRAGAQVPLFIEEDDSTVVHPDTLTRKKPGGKKLAAKTTAAETPREKSGSRIDSLIQVAYGYMGNRYRRGGTSTKGFDCSGFTMT